MLNEKGMKKLELESNCNHTLQNPSFLTIKQLWFKSHDLPNPSSSNCQHQLSFFKFGKTLGFQVERFLQFLDGVLYYYQKRDDLNYKGYCYLENIYLFWTETSSSQLLHLTNGTEYSQFFFKDSSFFKTIHPSFFRYVIQVNFSQKYIVEKLIGKGSFSKVYFAKNRLTEQKFAVKIVDKKDKNGGLTKNIVEEQKRILSLLESDNVCKMIQFYEQDDVFIFVLEFIEGTNLYNKYKQKSSLSFVSVLKILKSILKGLEYIHDKNIIHRDIKPQNIILNQDTLHTKIIDFGLSLFVSNNTTLKSYKRCGTMGYMAEQVIKNTAEQRCSYTNKCDMFSFGIIAHMFLLQQNPLKGKTYEETFSKNSDCRIKLNKDLIIKKYGISCLQFLQGLLQRDPKQRWSAPKALNCKFMKQKKVKNFQIISQQKHIEEYSPEKTRGNQNLKEDEFSIQKPKNTLMMGKKVLF